MTRSVIVPTDLAVLWLQREGVTPTQARSSIYWWSKRGQLPNHGSRTRGGARWDLVEIRALMWPRDPYAHPIDKVVTPDVP